MLVSTDPVAETERLEYWSEVVCRTFCEADIQSAPEGQGFHGSIEVERCGLIQLGVIRASPQRVLRTRSRIALSSRELCILMVQLRGGGIHTQDDRVGRLQPGDFMIVDTTRPYEHLFTHPFSQLVVTVPRDAVVSRLPNAHRLTACVVNGRSGVGQLASTFIRQFARRAKSLPDRSLARLEGMLLDLATTALGECYNQYVSPVGSTTDLLRERVLRFIEDHLGDPELSCSMVASRHRISGRHLRNLFVELPVGPSDWIWRRRLERARQDLTDPIKSALPVTTICYTWGFKDTAHFSRAFKARFGCTPGEARQRGSSGSGRP